MTKYMTNAEYREHVAAGARHYEILEPDGVTLVALAHSLDSALRTAARDGRTIQHRGVAHYVAMDGGWVWQSTILPDELN